MCLILLVYISRVKEDIILGYYVFIRILESNVYVFIFRVSFLDCNIRVYLIINS